MLEGSYQEDEADIVGAFIGDLCVGTASPSYEPDLNGYYTYMTISGNDSETGKNITFKFWDASTGHIYSTIETSPEEAVPFQDGTFHGDVAAPVYLNALDVIEQSIELYQGWNWFSVNVVPPAGFSNLLDQFKTNIADKARQLKASNTVLNYVTKWTGSITSITNTDMYMVYLPEGDHSLKLNGKPAGPAAIDIPVYQGWNWIAYTPQFTLSANDALAGASPADGDIIKTQGSFSRYSVVGGKGKWYGSIDTQGGSMQAGVGYMYYSGDAGDKSFKYPSVSSVLRSSSPLRSAEATTPHWKADMGTYVTNMTMIAAISLNGMEVTDGNWEIAAFGGDVCRGSIMMQTETDLPHPYVGFLMLYGDEQSKDSLSFRLYNHDTGREYAAAEKVGYVSDGMEGSVVEPLMLTASGDGATSVEGLPDGVGIYPNPVVTDLHITRPYGVMEKVELRNMQGRLMYSRNDFAEESIDMTDMTAGVYLLHLTHNGETVVLKVVKK
jgi:hypothetical protein